MCRGLEEKGNFEPNSDGETKTNCIKHSILNVELDGDKPSTILPVKYLRINVLVWSLKLLETIFYSSLKLVKFFYIR